MISLLTTMRPCPNRPWSRVLFGTMCCLLIGVALVAAWGAVHLIRRRRRTREQYRPLVPVSEGAQ